MTSAGISQVTGNYPGTMVGSYAASAAGTLSNDFSHVMNRTTQTSGKNPAEHTDFSVKAKQWEKAETGKKETVSEPSENSKAGDTLEKASQTVRPVDSDEKTSESDNMDETTKEAVEDVMETLETAIAQILGISTEELQEVMTDMNITDSDLLSTGNEQVLKQLLLQVSGETDSMSLLTDETLYGTMEQLEQAVNGSIADLSKQLGMDEKKLQNLLEQMKPQPEEAIPENVPFEEIGMAEQKASQGKTQEAGLNFNQKSDETVQPEETGKGTENVSVIDKRETTDENRKVMNQDQELEDIEEPLETRSEAKASGQGSQGEENRENGNSLFQEFAAKSIDFFKADAVLSGDSIPFETVDTQKIMNQITEFMKVQVKPDMTEVELQLQPETLGTINIRLSAKEGAVTAQFTAQNESVRAALESQVVTLKENLNEQGIKVEAVEVTVASHEFNRNLQEGSGENRQYGEAKKKAVRKLHLTEDISLDEMNLEEEDRIAAEMMQQNGNTVDFTA